MSNTAITPEVLDALERRYLPASEQKCVVCDAPLAFSASGERGGTRYNCSSEAASPSRSTLSFRERLLHYERSAWTDRGEADAWVVALVRAYRAWLQAPDGTAITSEPIMTTSPPPAISGGDQ